MPSRIDPVCSKRVDEREAAAQSRFSPYGNYLYYFCSMSCKQKFDQDCAIYATAVDVVCRREIVIGEAEESGLYEDREASRYYFCSEQCRGHFRLAPEFYGQLHQEDQHSHWRRPDMPR